MKITNLKRIELNDLSGRIRYSAVINGDKIIQYETEGMFRKHLTLDEWEKYVKVHARN